MSFTKVKYLNIGTNDVERISVKCDNFLPKPMFEAVNNITVRRKTKKLISKQTGKYVLSIKLGLHSSSLYIFGKVNMF